MEVATHWNENNIIKSKSFEDSFKKLNLCKNKCIRHEKTVKKSLEKQIVSILLRGNYPVIFIKNNDEYELRMVYHINRIHGIIKVGHPDTTIKFDELYKTYNDFNELNNSNINLESNETVNNNAIDLTKKTYLLEFFYK